MILLNHVDKSGWSGGNCTFVKPILCSLFVKINFLLVLNVVLFLCDSTSIHTECQTFFLVIWIESLHPLIRKIVLLLPSLGPREETQRRRGKGVGDNNSDEGTDTLVLYLYYNPSTCDSDQKLGTKTTFCCCCTEQLGIKIFIMVFSLINLGIIAVGKRTPSKA